MIPKVPFYFVRHGQTDWNVEGRMQGHTDIPLNSKGVQQAFAALERLRTAKIDVLVASPLMRAVQTALILAEGLEVPVYFDAQLKERSFGSFEGQITADVMAMHGIGPQDSITKILPSDAEQWPETVARNLAVRAKWLNKLQGKTVLFCDHGANFRATYEHTHGVRFEAKNATPYLFTPNENGWRMEEVV